MMDGKCEECGKYEITASNRISCEYPGCGVRMKVMEDGSC